MWTASFGPIRGEVLLLCGSTDALGAAFMDVSNFE